MKIEVYSRSQSVTARIFKGYIHRFGEDILREMSREGQLQFYEDSVRTPLEPIYRRISKEIDRATQVEIAPRYKNFRDHSTVLTSGEINVLCYTTTNTLGKVTSQLAYETGYDTEIEVNTTKGPLKLDLEMFLRKLQNKAFEYFQKEFGYGKQPIAAQIS